MVAIQLSSSTPLIYRFHLPHCPLMAQIQDDPVVTDDPSRRGDAPDKLGSSHEAMLEGGK